MSKAARTLFASVIVVIAAIVLMNLVGPSGFGFNTNRPEKFSQYEFISQAKAGQIDTANWQGTEITGKLADGRQYVADVPDSDGKLAENFGRQLDEAKVKWQVERPPVSTNVIAFLSMFAVPLLLFLAVYLFFIRPAQAGGNQALSFGRSKAKRVGDTGTKITFDDVAGIEEAKQELFEIVDFLKNTKKYVALGAKIPKGILLTGPPGVGKTFCRYAISNCNRAKLLYTPSPMADNSSCVPCSAIRPFSNT